MIDEGMVRFEEVKVVAATQKAICCRIDIISDVVDVWIPKSQVDAANSEVWKKDDEGLLVVTMWIAEKKGLV